LPNANPTWSYDPADNRSDATSVDNLNRATTIGGVSRTYDILGNTLTKGSGVTYGWDCLNRMTSLTDGTGITNYEYRADGMRVALTPGLRLTVPPPVLKKRFRYDGQMPIETSILDLNTSALTVDRNGLGARGIDCLSSTTSSGSAVSYPVYDAHGNMVATLARSGSGYAVSNRRAYDAWGLVRQGAVSGHPDGRHSANLGHVQDDESGLVYMRARYYDPGTGRFISQDAASDGRNWFVYCQNDPINFADQTGQSALLILNLLLGGIGVAIGYAFAVWLVRQALNSDTKMRAEVKEIILSNYDRTLGGIHSEVLESLFGAVAVGFNPTLAGLLDGSLVATGLSVMRACGTSLGVGLVIGFAVGLYMAMLSFWITAIAFDIEGFSTNYE
jgi:RHS repeat-associated protein